ncbi:MAG: sugar ABC transporter substrate-binding protein, partial [Chloroflexi bacterium]|nr:sugar ABC transporter substrate-binding protein [Chloroflexota bacterium]
FDRASAVVPPNAHVGADSYNQAITTAEAFAALLAENGVTGQCIELQGALTDINAVNRSQGWQDVEATTDVYTTLVQVPTEWNPELFRSGTANALQANPDANCMFVASDFAFSAVQSALEAADRWAPAGEEGHMWIAAQDLNPQGLEAMEGGYIDVATTYDAFFHAIEAVNAIGALATETEAVCGAAIDMVQATDDAAMMDEGEAMDEAMDDEAMMDDAVMGEGMPIGDYVCLVAGRVATPANVADLENLWSRDYQD